MHYELCIISYLCTSNREIISLFIRLVVRFFKVKIMLLDFQTTVMLASVVIVSALSIITLMHTNVR